MRSKDVIARKKPVDVRAWRFNGAIDFPDWLRGKASLCDGKLRIETLEGVLTAEHGDWIVRGVHGEVYPVKPDIFSETYEVIG